MVLYSLPKRTPLLFSTLPSFIRHCYSILFSFDLSDNLLRAALPLSSPLFFFLDEETSSERQSTQSSPASLSWWKMGVWTRFQDCLLSLQCLEACLSSLITCAPEGCKFILFIFMSSMPNIVCHLWWTSHKWLMNECHSFSHFAEGN